MLILKLLRHLKELSFFCCEQLFILFDGVLVAGDLFTSLMSVASADNLRQLLHVLLQLFLEMLNSARGCRRHRTILITFSTATADIPKFVIRHLLAELVERV